MTGPIRDVTDVVWLPAVFLHFSRSKYSFFCFRDQKNKVQSLKLHGMSRSDRKSLATMWFVWTILVISNLFPQVKRKSLEFLDDTVGAQSCKEVV